jgi:hypothetical protein
VIASGAAALDCGSLLPLSAGSPAAVKHPHRQHPISRPPLRGAAPFECGEHRRFGKRVTPSIAVWIAPSVPPGFHNPAYRRRQPSSETKSTLEQQPRLCGNVLLMIAT